RGVEYTSNRMHRRDLDCFGGRESWENRWQSSREHRLAGAWRTDENDSMRAGGSDGERTLRTLLPCDVREVEQIVRGDEAACHAWRRQVTVLKPLDQFIQRSRCCESQRTDERSLGNIRRR